MLFQARFLAGIEAGTLTLTFRAWQRARVSPGRQYRCGTVMIQVEAVDLVAVSSITPAQARAAGFDSVSQLLDLLRATAPRVETRAARVYRVRFRCLGRAATPPPPTVSRAVLDGLEARLDRMDRLSHRPAWTREALRTIAEHPRIAAARLAPHVGRKTRDFKADIRRLKALGLTRSFEVGYELSALGRAVVRRHRRFPRRPRTR